MIKKRPDMENLRLFKNDYFYAKGSVVREFGEKVEVFITVYRCDTGESYECFYLWGSDIDQWSIEAERFVTQLDKPIDWKRPHRYCLARYAQLVLDQDRFSERLDDRKLLSDRDIVRYMIIRQLKETVLIKRANQLSFKEKVQLLTIKDWEVNENARIGEDVHYALFGREYFYKRLYDKKQFASYYQVYCQKMEEIFGKYEALLHKSNVDHSFPIPSNLRDTYRVRSA